MKFSPQVSPQSKILIFLMVVGLFIAGLGLGANIRSTQPKPVTGSQTQTRGGRLTPIAGYLLWGGVGLVFACLVPLLLEVGRQAKDKAAL